MRWCRVGTHAREWGGIAGGLGVVQGMAAGATERMRQRERRRWRRKPRMSRLPHAATVEGMGRGPIQNKQGPRESFRRTSEEALKNFKRTSEGPSKCFKGAPERQQGF